MCFEWSQRTVTLLTVYTKVTHSTPNNSRTSISLLDLALFRCLCPEVSKILVHLAAAPGERQHRAIALKLVAVTFQLLNNSTEPSSSSIWRVHLESNQAWETSRATSDEEIYVSAIWYCYLTETAVWQQQHSKCCLKYNSSTHHFWWEWRKAAVTSLHPLKEQFFGPFGPSSGNSK
jgi:hypothetical protein